MFLHDKVKREIAGRNLHHLSKFDSPKKPVARDGFLDKQCQIILEDLRGWGRDNKASIDRAIEAQTFGGKQPIDWNIAFLPFMESMAVYLRDYGTLFNAVNAYSRWQSSGQKDPSLYHHSITTYLDAQAQIDSLADDWGMDFVQICDLPYAQAQGHPFIDGPYCGAFVSRSPQKPFIGLVFKGTKPTNPAEVNVDAQYQLRATGPYLDNQNVSKGVFSALFGRFNQSKTTAYQDILDKLKALAQPLYKASGQPVRVHVTGHSLGGSYASLCMAQLMMDIAPSPTRDAPLVMGDAYTFGSPRVGSESWADMNAKLVDIHEGQIWRIVNSDDIVPLVPPSDLKPDVGFYHLDTGIRIFTDYPPAPLPTERGGPPPTGIKVGSIPELVARVLGSSNHCQLCN